MLDERAILVSSGCACPAESGSAGRGIVGAGVRCPGGWLFDLGEAFFLERNPLDRDSLASFEGGGARTLGMGILASLANIGELSVEFPWKGLLPLDFFVFFVSVGGVAGGEAILAAVSIICRSNSSIFA